MKLSKSNLIKLIQEVKASQESILLEMPAHSTTGAAMGARDNVPAKDPDGYEGHMAKKSLYHMARQADQLHDMLMDDQNLEPWVQAKITKAADYLKAAFESITYEKDNPKGR